MSRRKSVEQLATLAQLADNPSPDLFSLLDLIVFSLRSSQPQTVTASLRLVTILLRRHHPYVRNQLFSLEPMGVSARQNLNNLNHVMMTLFDQATCISQVGSIDQSYQAALQDAQVGMERHSCLIDESLRTSPDLSTWVISRNCKVMEQALITLSAWFTNDTLVNLELTGMLTSLAACEYILMRSWLAPAVEPSDQQISNSFNVISIIGQLVKQVKQWRSQFVEWDAFYSIQRVNIASDSGVPDNGQPEQSKTGDKLLQTDDARSFVSGTSSRHPSSRVTSEETGSKDTLTSPRKASSRLSEQQRAATRSRLDRSRSEHSEILDETSDVVAATLLETRIPVRSSSASHDAQDQSSNSGVVVEDTTTGNESPAGNGNHTKEPEEDSEGLPTASLRHLLTQAIILQEFILELAAALQIRATLFDEVDLS